MLVLSRKIDESVMIGDGIEVRVVDIRGDKVRLGIEAPNKIPVHRREVYEKIKEDNLRENYERFKTCLKYQGFQQAFDIIYQNRNYFEANNPLDKITKDEIDKMVYGLFGKLK